MQPSLKLRIEFALLLVLFGKELKSDTPPTNDDSRYREDECFGISELCDR